MGSGASRIAPSASVASVVAALIVNERDCDEQALAMPRPEGHLVVRFGASVGGDLDVHAMGGRQTVLRKTLRAGLRTVMVRFHLGAAEAVLGVPATALAGRVVALEQLWGAETTRRLFDRLAGASDTVAAARVLETAIAERLAAAAGLRASVQLVRAAANRLRSASVNVVADDLGVSERHLRRLFRETVGVGPKQFAQLTRFGRAVRAASEARPMSWASIAVAAGYYDQAHLITEFRAIAGVTPKILLGELRAAQPIG